MRFCISLVLLMQLFSLTELKGQFTLSGQVHVPSVGDSFSYFIDHNPSFSVSNAGPNQIWNFFPALGAPAITSYISLVNASDPSTFPFANLVMVSDSVETYLACTSFDCSELGRIIPNSKRIIYSDKREVLQFPAVYGNAFTSSFSGTVQDIVAGLTYSRQGNSITSIDGHGRLNLSYGTVNNVMRIRTVVNYTDKYFGVTHFDHTDTLFSWYNAWTRNYIAYYNIEYVNGALQNRTAGFIQQPYLVTSSDDNLNSSPDLIISPVPSADFVLIKTSEYMRGLRITDLSGVQMLEMDGLNTRELSLDFSKWAAGYYLLSLMTSKKIIAGRIIIR